MPGVLAQMNNILAESGVNIDDQLLSTRGDYGYLITDISASYPDDLPARLARTGETVSLRFLPRNAD